MQAASEQFAQAIGQEVTVKLNSGQTKTGHLEMVDASLNTAIRDAKGLLIIRGSAISFIGLK